MGKLNEEKLKYHRQYKKKNKEKVREWARKYREKNKDKIRERNKEYRKRPEKVEKVKGYHRKYKESHKKEIKERSQRWFRNNKDKYREYNRRSRAKKRTYRLEHPELFKKRPRKRKNKSLEEIAGRPRPEQCEVCKKIGTICFDHDHKTGKFRGWICNSCNLILGFANDNTEVLTFLISYLEKSKMSESLKV